MYRLLDSFAQTVYPHCPVELKLLEPLLKLRPVEKGEYLFREGDPCDFVGLTQSGCLRSFFLEKGKEITLFFHPESYTFGDYESLRRQQPACFSCQAIEDSVVLTMDNRALDALESLENGQKLLRLVVEDLAFLLRDRLLSLYRDPLERRYLDFVEAQPNLVQRIPQYYIASYLGVEPESLSRLKRRILNKQAS